MNENKRYVADGVYVEYDGFEIILTTENGISVQNRIVLEPDTWAMLNHQLAALRTQHGERGMAST
jgi:hypothetical protein